MVFQTLLLVIKAQFLSRNSNHSYDIFFSIIYQVFIIFYLQTDS